MPGLQWWSDSVEAKNCILDCGGHLHLPQPRTGLQDGELACKLNSAQIFEMCCGVTRFA